ncbi:MAG TPA: hypothetical protein VM012_11130 [Flavitalea sp.]|nr:hypothetical protein [Flavitalea sp.]
MGQNENGMTPYLKSLSRCLKRMITAGYTEIFKKTDSGLKLLNSSRTYAKEEIKVMNSFRFEGRAGVDSSATMYVIETSDGLKGTMVDAGGRRSDVELRG